MIKPTTYRFLLAVAFFFLAHQVVASDTVETVKDNNGWKLLVNGENFFVKGVVWGYSPKGENYSYNLWDKPDDFIKKVLQQDFSMMMKAGVNAIRSFSTIPPKWVTYINDTYGIKTAINPLMGRYGALIDGVWTPNTDYSDKRTRQILIDEVLEVVARYRDVRGVLMFALGNEANYGLSWSSFEIENLPVGEQQAAKAKYLYSMYADAIRAGRYLAPNKPFTIVNGDIQYMSIIRESLGDMDLLGVNAYRGKNFTSLWKDVSDGLDLPVLFFEFGSDALNAKTGKEAQKEQADLLVSQWKDMYSQSHGNGYSNSIGGFVFQWRDEWWKYKQVENLTKHDKTASWSNGGYEFDYVEGRNNMNEEWWGITRMGDINEDGVYVTEPRVALDALTSVWALDPFVRPSASASTIAAIDTSELLAKANKRDDEMGWGISQQPIWFDGGELRLEAIKTRSDDKSLDNTDVGQMVFLDFGFQFGGNLSGDLTLNAIGDAADSAFEFRYGDRIIDDNDPRYELYDFQANYTGRDFDLSAFYHVPRYHWGYEGDFFGLLRETTDMTSRNGQDTWNEKAPYGAEFVGKNSLDGLKVVAGEEIYWGANPKFIAKYQFGPNKQFTVMRSQDYGEAESGGGGPGSTTSSKSSQTTVQAKLDLSDDSSLQVGAIQSNSEKIGQAYDYWDGGVKTDTIDEKDTFGVRALLTHQLNSNAVGHVQFNYAGLVADSGNPLREFGTNLPLSGAGNQKSIEAGLRITQGDFTLFPRVYARDNLEGPMPTIPALGATARNIDADPFAVLGNRETRAAELFVTYDPTPATPFYDWNNDAAEDASFAFNVGLTVAKFPDVTDVPLYFNDQALAQLPLGNGLPEEDVWLYTSKLVLNPSPGFKAIVKFLAGKQQPTKFGYEPDQITDVAPTHFRSVEGRFYFNHMNILTVNYLKDAWGPYDFHKEFNSKYPTQIELGYTRLLDNGLSEDMSSQVGVKLFHRDLDQYSPEYVAGSNEDMSEIQVFFKKRF